MRHLWKILAAAVLGASPLLAASADSATDFPTRSIRLVVPYAAGGALDMVGRVYAQQLGDMLGQPVVVENRPGGSALIGIKSVQQAPADGYTLLMSTTTFNTNPIVYKAPGYATEDFSVVAGLGISGLLLLSNKKVPVKDYGDLMSYARANPGKLNMGVLGGGGITQLLASRFQHVTGIRTTEIAYKGGAPAMQDLLGGNIDIFIDPMPTAIPQLAGGHLRPLASTTESRSALAPDVPTFKELGVPEMVGGAWFAVHVAAKTPQPLIDKLRQQSAAMMKNKGFLEKLVGVKVDPWSGSFEAFQQYLKVDKALWDKDARRIGLAGTL